LLRLLKRYRRAGGGRDGKFPGARSPNQPLLLSAHGYPSRCLEEFVRYWFTFDYAPEFLPKSYSLSRQIWAIADLDGTFAPNGYTSNGSMSYYSEFGVGWRFNNNFLAEYVFSTDYGKTSPSHIFLLRYTFHKREH